MELSKLFNERDRLESETEASSQKYILLSSSYNKNIQLFRDKVLNSEKIEYLPSYINYINLIEKKEKSEQSVEDMQKTLSQVRIAIETGVWKNSEKQYADDSSIKNVQNLLVEEAKRSKYFKDEYKVLLDIEEDIMNINETSSQLRENLKRNESEIQKNQKELEECRKNINIINDMYPDMEAAYWV